MLAGWLLLEAAGRPAGRMTAAWPAGLNFLFFWGLAVFAILSSQIDPWLAGPCDWPAAKLPLAGSCLAARLASGLARRPARCSPAGPKVV